MTTYNGVTTVDAKSTDGISSVQIMAAEIEGGGFGFGVAERKGLEFRQIGSELEIDAARELYEALGAYIQRQTQ